MYTVEIEYKLKNKKSVYTHKLKGVAEDKLGVAEVEFLTKRYGEMDKVNYWQSEYIEEED